jgi:hypothetical protein
MPIQGKDGWWRDVALIGLVIGNLARGCHDTYQNEKLKSIEAMLESKPIEEVTDQELPESYELNGQRFYLRTVDEKPAYFLEE